jgi:hypothetical protein
MPTIKMWHYMIMLYLINSPEDGRILPKHVNEENILLSILNYLNMGLFVPDSFIKLTYSPLLT